MKKTPEQHRKEIKEKLTKIEARIMKLQRQYDSLYQKLIKKYPENKRFLA